MTTTTSPSAAPVSDLVFVGFNRRVAAIHRESGQITWHWRAPQGSGPVALMLDGDRLIASVNGYTYCLDAASGQALWQNDLKGFGIGIPCLTSYRSSSMASSMLAHQTAAASNNDSINN